MRKRGYIRCAVLVMSLALASGMGLTGCGHKKTGGLRAGG